MFPHSQEDDPRIGGGDRGQGSSSLCRTVHLGEDHTGDTYRLVECIRLRTCLLSDL